MTLATGPAWPQQIDPLHAPLLSAAVAAIPLFLLLLLMGGLRKSGLFAAVFGLLSAAILALGVWHMPIVLAVTAAIFGMVYAVWPILWIVFAALWLYGLAQKTGSFDLLRRWMAEHASDDVCIHAILIAFSFGALLEGTAGFGAPVAITAYLLSGLGMEARRAVTVSLVANTAPVAFGGLGIPIVALAGVTGLNLHQLSAMVGRQVPFLSLVLPAYLVLIVGGVRGLKRTWPAALIAGGAFAVVQFSVSNIWGPYAADVLAASLSIAALVAFLRIWRRRRSSQVTQELLSSKQTFLAWFPWVLLSVVMTTWTYLGALQAGQITHPVPYLHNRVFISLYGKPYAAAYTFQPLGPGTAVLVTVVIAAFCLRVRPRVFFTCGAEAFGRLKVPGLTVILIVALAYLYNYSGMAYTLGDTLAGAGPAFPLLSGCLGWIACFLSGSDTSANLLFGNLQVAAAHQLHLSPILLAATNSSGAVAGKVISPQNIAVGVTTLGLIGAEGSILLAAFKHSIVLAAFLSLLAFAQAYWLSSWIPR